MVNGEEATKKAQSDFNPETILLSHFSFRRPANWQWIHTEPADRNDIITEITFRIADPIKDDRHATVLMNHFKPNITYSIPDNVTKRWKTWFTEVQQQPSQMVTIGEHKVTFIELAGSYLGPGASKKKKAAPNYLLYGAIIEDEAGNVVARFYGPEKLVEKSKFEFKEMIEKAVKQD